MSVRKLTTKFAMLLVLVDRKRSGAFGQKRHEPLLSIRSHFDPTSLVSKPVYDRTFLGHEAKKTGQTRGLVRNLRPDATLWFAGPNQQFDSGRTGNTLGPRPADTARTSGSCVPVRKPVLVHVYMENQAGGG